MQIINDANFERLSKLIDNDAVFYGGQTDAAKRYIAPTVLRDVTFDDTIMKDEIFGPILPVLTYTNLDSAIQKVLEQPKPLSAYVFTASKKNKKKVLQQLSFGGGMVNDAVMHVTNSNMPFGGVGTSGIGSYHGKIWIQLFFTS